MFIYLFLSFRFKKRQQVNNNSSDAFRFERILNTIGGEPNWIRLQTIAGLRSEPNLLSSVSPTSQNNSEPLVVKVDEIAASTESLQN